MTESLTSWLAVAWLACSVAACSADALATSCTADDECARGEACVAERCTSSPDGGCEGECACESDSQCAVGVPACVDARCVEGSCFFRADDTRCAASAICDSTRGCVGPEDGGVERDAGDADAGDADAGDTDAGDTDAGDADAGDIDAGAGGCGIVSADPTFEPSGYTAHVVAWEDAFYGNTFPVIDAGGLAPVGSFTFRSSSSPSGIAMAGRYISVPFVPAAESNYRLEWNRSQAVLSRGYRANYPADAIYVTISPCPGDFRLPDSTVPRTDPRSASCSEYAQDGVIYYGTTGGGFQCVLEAGRTYYLNIVFANPFDGLDPTESTCADGPYCNANFGD